MNNEGTDYINANYIAGFTSEKQYIAAQGSVACSLWRGAH